MFQIACPEDSGGKQSQCSASSNAIYIEIKANAVEGKVECNGKVRQFKKFQRREIKNSFGEAEMRFVIKTTVKILNHIIKAEFSLSDRDKLRFPVLIGRKTLRHRFLIDVTKKDISFHTKQRGV